MKRNALYFVAPRQVDIRQEAMPKLAADQVLVRTRLSAISAGTEMLIYRNEFPDEMMLDACLPTLLGKFGYPLAYGYACVGEVLEVGAGVDPSWRERWVFAFQPHVSHFIASPDSLLPVPEGIPLERACFLPNLETAINLVQDAAPLLGERVLVLGQGVVGLLTTALLACFPLAGLVTADRYARRRVASQALGVSAALDPSAPDFRSQARAWLASGADLTLELSGAPEALNDALMLTGFSGRVIIGSWYGKKPMALALGGEFHRSRIRLMASQVSSIAPELSGRWDKRRRFALAWDLLARLRPEQWITHRFPIGQAADAYRLLDEAPGEAIQVLLEY
ncbi:MAG: zinc-binding dehydrogenase [Anaerolineales bacterium]|nr:zinc-binding dehydrogenase [Anaerolineales bacterium]